MSATQVAARLGVTRRTIARACDRGEFPGARKVGAAGWAIPVSALASFVPKGVGRPRKEQP